MASDLLSLLGTTLTTFRISVNGPMWKTIGDTLLACRNITDSAYRRVQGADPVDAPDLVTKGYADAADSLKTDVSRVIDTIDGIQGGGDLTADRTFSLAVNSLVELLVSPDPVNDFLLVYHGSGTDHKKIKLPLLIAAVVDGLFGSNYQLVKDEVRTTTTNPAPQDKVVLTTGALTGTFLVTWTAIVDNASDLGEFKLENKTDAVTLDGPVVWKANDANEFQQVGGFAEVVLAGVSKDLAIQFNDQAGGNTQGIQQARISIWKVGS